MENLDSILRNYPDKPSALLPVLNKAQELYGWLSPEAIESVAEALGLTPAHVRGVATFHDLYRRKSPGRHTVQLCTNVTCMLFGAESLLEVIEKEFGMIPGQTSADGRFHLLVMECIGACDKAPAMVIDSKLYHISGRQALVETLEAYK